MTLALSLAAAALALRAEAQIVAPTPTAQRRAVPVAPDFKQVSPLLAKYCGSCHGGDKKKGDLSFEVYRNADEKKLLADIDVWHAVAEQIDAKDMPPEEKPQPSSAEIELILAWVGAAEAKVAAAGKRNPGRVTARRLNRAEYNNTVRDLLGIDIKPANDFPADDVGYGFDNIGDVLTMPPILVERYLTAAERIADKVIVPELAPKFRTHTVQIERLAPTPPGSVVRAGQLLMAASGAVRAQYEFPIDAEYAFKVRASSRGTGGEAPRLALKIDGREVRTVEVRSASTYTVRAPVEGGLRRIELAFTNGARVEQLQGVQPRQRRQLALDLLRIEGPARRQAKARALPESHTRIIPRPAGKDSWRQDAREFLSTLATRAFRRPVSSGELDRLAGFVERAVLGGDSFERGMQLALRAVLVSPHFLYRLELDEAVAGEPRTLNDWELASRLSFFVWSSMPDDELFRLAAEGTLRQDEVLGAQVRRMLQDPRARALVDNFATQWLQIRNLTTIRPSRRHFPTFDDELRGAMLKETELFFESVVKDDLPLVTFLDADFTFLNERLARHYGIEGIEGREFRRVSLDGTPRGGLLTHASILTVTSNPTRTSPVKRGRWVLEQLLGTPPPPPPPGVPELAGEDRKNPLSGTLRQQLEEHRKDPNCAVCHRKMDPLGFGLENFDAVGAWRTEEPGGASIDPSGILPNGSKFTGPAELKAVLRTKEAAFRRSLATKLLTFALGRGTEPYDRASIDDICAYTAGGGDTFSSLVLGIVKSDPFLKRRGEN